MAQTSANTPITCPDNGKRYLKGFTITSKSGEAGFTVTQQAVTNAVKKTVTASDRSVRSWTQSVVQQLRQKQWEKRAAALDKSVHFTLDESMKIEYEKKEYFKAIIAAMAKVLFGVDLC